MEVKQVVQSQIGNRQADKKNVAILSEGGRVYYGNIFLPLLLSMKDRNMLEEKHGDLADWIELKLFAKNVTEVKKGRYRCWLVSAADYQSALRVAGYAGRNITPINVTFPLD